MTHYLLPRVGAFILTFTLSTCFSTAGTVDITEFKVAGTGPGVAHLKEILGKTGGYKGEGEGVIEIKEDDSLPTETMKAVISDKKIVISGNPAKWAVHEFVGQKLGVRYIWPGRLGTYVPKRERVVIDDANINFRPHLYRRDFRQRKAGPPISDWCDTHYLSIKRTPKGLNWGHAQHDWYAKYSKTHPDLFALSPKNDIKPWSNEAKWAKLRISSPKVWQFVVDEWVKKGKPNGICLSPTDAPGYDTSPETMAWDPVKYAREEVWSGKGCNLTDRHVRYWNTIYDKVSKLNPNVKVAVYAYGAYREPPKTEKLRPNVYHISMVPTWFDEDKRVWHGWGEQAEALYLRPNWPFVGYSAPYFQLHKMGHWINFAYENKMRGFDVDSLCHYYGVRGPFNYLIIRLMAHPEMKYQDVLTEFYSAFGGAAEDVRRHYEYWEKHSDTIGMPVTAGGPVGGDPEGLYIKTMEREKMPVQPLAGSQLMMPFLYNDDVVDPAIQILKDALPKAEGEDRERVQFLIDAYEPFKKEREMVRVYNEVVYRKRDKSLIPKLRELDKQFVEAHNRVYEGISRPKHTGMNKWLQKNFQARTSLDGL
jgi:hypothetical protein